MYFTELVFSPKAPLQDETVVHQVASRNGGVQDLPSPSGEGEKCLFPPCLASSGTKVSLTVGADCVNCADVSNCGHDCCTDERLRVRTTCDGVVFVQKGKRGSGRDHVG